MWAELRAQFGGGPAAPSSAASTDLPAAPASPAHNQSLLLGVILLVIGLVALGNNTGLVNWSVLWPVLLITIGVFLLLRSAQRKF